MNTLIKYPLLTILLCCSATLLLNAQSGTPKISIQGTLKSASGVSVADGDYDVRFNLYNVPTGGTALWFEDTTVTVIGGIYSHYLGSVEPLDPNDFASTLYLGVKVGSYELTPRSELAYAPYSFSVSFAQNAIEANHALSATLADSALSAATATSAATADKVVCSGAVGDIKYSILNPAQFAAENGDCWVPMDGRALAPSDRLRQITSITTLPDGGGLFIRGQEFNGGADNDPDRSNSSLIGTIQQDNFKSHTHTISPNDGAHSHQFGIEVDGNSDLPGTQSDTYLDDLGSKEEIDDYLTTETDGAHSHTIQPTGGNETRPKNLNFWVYIRIN